MHQKPFRSHAHPAKGRAAAVMRRMAPPARAVVPPLTLGSLVLYHGVLHTWVCRVIHIHPDGRLVFQKADAPPTAVVLRLVALPTAFRPSGVALVPWAVHAAACMVSAAPDA